MRNAPRRAHKPSALMGINPSNWKRATAEASGKPPKQDSGASASRTVVGRLRRAQALGTERSFAPTRRNCAHFVQGIAFHFEKSPTLRLLHLPSPPFCVIDRDGSSILRARRSFFYFTVQVSSIDRDFNSNEKTEKSVDLLDRMEILDKIDTNIRSLFARCFLFSPIYFAI